MKSIVRKPVASAIGFAAILFFSFAAPAQTPSDRPAKFDLGQSVYVELAARSFPVPGSAKYPVWPVYIDVYPRPRTCFCDEDCFAALQKQERLLQRQQRLFPSPDRQRFYLNHENEIQVIDFDGLKKFLQRDPKDTRPLLINFWATWCDTCREEFPDLVKIDQDYREKGLNFVAISLDDVSDIKTKVVDFLKEVRAKMPVIVLNVPDADPAIHFVDPNWGGEMPATFLYDKEGKVVFKYFGKVKPDELRAAIDKQLAVKQ
jgi:thiol-disulfide isomerase/thioredoxin